MRKRESAVRLRSEVIKGSGEGPFWEQKIKTMLLSHLPQSRSHLMWPLQAARPEPTLLGSRSQMKIHILKYVLTRVAIIRR